VAKSMQVTRACDYACRALVYLARNGTSPVQTAKVASEVDVPPMYLRKILQSLSRAGFVRTSTGSGGGITLAQSPAEISLKDVVEAVEGPIVVSQCIPRPETCRNSGACKVRLNLAAVQDRLHHEFSSRKISDLV